MTKKNEASEKRKDATREGENRYTFILNDALAEKIKDISYWDRKLLKETVHEALAEYIAKYEKKNGPIKARPDSVKERESKRSKGKG